MDTSCSVHLWLIDEIDVGFSRLMRMDPSVMFPCPKVVGNSVKLLCIESRE